MKDCSIFIATTDSLYYCCNIPLEAQTASSENTNEAKTSSVQTTKDNSNYYIQYHTLSCCGIDFSSDSKYIAVGDLGCNFMIWERNGNTNAKTKNDSDNETKENGVDNVIANYDSSDNNYTPIVAEKAVMSVRSIKWIPNSEYILIGCLDGSLCLYVFDSENKLNSNSNSNSNMSVVSQLDSRINCLEFADQYYYSNTNSISNFKQLNNVKDNNIIVAGGLSNGKIYIYKLIEKIVENRRIISVEIIIQFLAHKPVHSKDKEYRKKFGSIHIAADIWTCVFAPYSSNNNKTNNNNNIMYLATGSEDQSTKIWKISKKDNSINWQEKNVIVDEIITLRGHTAAVTCVDWTFVGLTRNMGIDTADKPNNNCNCKKELLATCADDRKVMIWDVNHNREKENGELSFVLLYSLLPQNVHGWFTFTYLRFQRDGNKLSLGTENGYVVIFKLYQQDVNKDNKNDDELNTSQSKSQSKSEISMKQIFGQCLHRGSIEGLECDKNGLVTSCASDCTVVVLQK